ncbi:MAG: response regulator [Desulfobacula sp.]|jgi:putative two-component system response regulator|nr:response regulator [Desulfobacula sp.]MBT7261011.1 response regulator [Desulfobacula sp.]
MTLVNGQARAFGDFNSGSGRILVVDDEARNLRMMEAMLISKGYDAVLVESGKQAIDIIKTCLPDVILLDVMMPGMNGFEVAQVLKANNETCHIPIVMVTSLYDVEDRVKAFEAGADDFLSKPVDKTELIARVRSLIKVKAFHDHLINYQTRLENEVEKRTKQLNKAYGKIRESSFGTIQRLSRAAEYKDEDTGAHIQRMSHYSAAIARQMGMNDTVVESILLAAGMHDVGKIGIPDHILMKPGKLDKEEWQTMKLHTIIGGAILTGEKAGFIRLAERIALTHHEKWDGSGYPRGLSQKKIPIAGRIVAMGDVFDALTSKRPYKEAFSNEKSFSIIRENTGSHFDPDVSKAFFAVTDQILSIKESYKDDEASLLLQMTGKTD